MSFGALLSVLLAFAPSLGTEGLEVGKVRIESNTKDGRVYYSIEARIVSLQEFLGAVSQKAGVRFEGLDSGAAQSMVNVSVAERRLDEILTYVLGSVELSFLWEGQVIRLHAIPTGETSDGRAWLTEAGIKSSAQAQLKYPAFTDSTRLDFLIAQSYEKDGLIEKANNKYQGIIKNFKGAAEEPEAMLALGRNFLAMGEIEKAREYLRILVNDYPRVPGTPEAWFLLGRCLLILDQVEMAEDYLEAMTENFGDSPFAPMAQIYLADAKRRVHKSEEAQVMLQKVEAASMLEPRLEEEFLLVYGKVLFDRGDFKKSASLLCEFAGLHPNRKEANPALFLAARACFQGKDYLSALLLAQACEGRNEIDPVEWNHFAIELRDKLQLRGRLNPTEPGAAALSTARSLRAVKKYDEALETLERFFDDFDFGARARVEAASCRLEKGDAEGCIRVLHAAIPQCREAALVNEAFRILGDAYALQGMHQEAADAYQGLLRKTP